MELFFILLMSFTYLTGGFLVGYTAHRDKWFKKKRRQTTFCYCPKCKNELVSSDSFISDIDGIVTYKCKSCGYESIWDFCIAPFPVLIKKEQTP